MRKVLILGDDTRSFLAIVRSLGRNGLEVHVAPFNFQAPALTSRYISRVHWLPYYLDGREWLNAFESLLSEERFDLVIPCDERSLIPLHLHRKQMSAWTRLAIPDPHSLDTLFDKGKTREFARMLGIQVAPGRVVEESDTAQTLLAEVGLPLALKPCSSYTVDRLYARNRVIIATNKQELASAFGPARTSPHYFEAFFPGIGAGVSVLANRGRILQAFEHRRVHELHGSSYYRVSHALTPGLLDAVTKVIAGIAYTGVAMFEFRVNPDTQTWILLEVNARPWGSLPLPVSIGVDFPYLWYRLLVDGIETAPRPYKDGIYGRNLVPDASYVLARLDALRKQPIKMGAFLLHTVGEYARLFTGREVYDVHVIDDPRPGWSEIVRKVREAAAHLMAKLLGFERRGRDRRLLRRAARRAGDDRFAVVIVCQGNICRSPLAAALLRRELARDAARIRVRSFGNLPRRGAFSPPNAIAAAGALDVDLRAHRSRHFTRAAAEAAGVVVVFDQTNRRWIDERYPGLKAPVVMLGSFSSGEPGGRIIADPDGGDLAQFERTYAAIADAVKGLARKIREARRG